jgi:hypothetical protein
MADGLVPKPPSLSAAGSRSKRVRSGYQRVGLLHNLKAIFCSRFAADAATVDRRRNHLLRLAAAQDAGSVRIDRAGRRHTFSRKPSRSQSLPLHLVAATGA